MILTFIEKNLNTISLFVIVFFIAKLILNYIVLFNFSLVSEYETFNTILQTGNFVFKISFAVWIYIEARNKQDNALIWTLLTLIFGLIAIFAYYWRIIYLKNKL